MAETDKKNWFKRHKILTIVLVVVVVAVIASTGGSKTNTSNSTTAKNSNSTAQLAKINQPASDGKFQFVVTSIQCGQPSVSSADGYITKTAQGQYCLLNITANNTGNQSQTLDS